MEKKLTFSLDGNNILRSGANGLAPQKGSEALPYTVSEYEVLVESGEWNGGFVERLGMVESQSMPSDGTDGYYSDWDFDISEYIGRDDDNPKYEGSVSAKKNKRDCAYRCMAYCVEGISSIGVGDLYGDWAYHKGYVEKEGISEHVAKGMDSRKFANFLIDVLPRFNKRMEVVNITSVDSICDYFRRNPNVKAVGMIDLSGLGEGDGKYKDKYHEVIVKGVDNNANLVYYDPQTPDNDVVFSVDKLRTLFSIKNR